MNGAISTIPSRARLRAFALGSVVLHGIALASWQTLPWMTGQANSVISVTLVSNHAGAAPVETRLTSQPARRIEPRSNSDMLEKPAESPGTNPSHARVMALPATPATTEPASMDTRAGGAAARKEKVIPTKDAKQDNDRDRSIPASPSAPAIGEDNERDQANAQIRARLYTDLARYFDYPYVARLRGWEGAVLLAFNIEANGHLKEIRVARSSGYAVLDDSALSALRKVQRLMETDDLLPGRKLAMRIPVIYRLRCPDNQTCRGNSLAAGPEDR